MKTLAELYGESEGFRELRALMQSALEQRGLKLMFDGESTVGMADAKKAIDAAFDALDEKFGVKEKIEKKKFPLR